MYHTMHNGEVIFASQDTIYIFYTMILFAYKAMRREKLASHKKEYNSERHCINIFCCINVFCMYQVIGWESENKSKKSMFYDEYLYECTELSMSSSS